MHYWNNVPRLLFEFLQYERILKKVGVKIVSITQETSDDAAGETY